MGYQEIETDDKTFWCKCEVLKLKSIEVKIKNIYLNIMKNFKKNISKNQKKNIVKIS